MKEIWKDIPGYEGLYQASNLGTIRSLDRYVNGVGGHFKKIKGRIMTGGMYSTRLLKEGLEFLMTRVK